MRKGRWFMSGENVQTGNPGGVRNPPAPRAALVPCEDLDYPQPWRDLPLVRRRRNLPALLSCFSGGFGLLLAFACFLASGGAHWLVWLNNPLAPLASGLLGVIALVTGLIGYNRSFGATGTRGVFALMGMVAGLLIIAASALVFLAQAMGAIEC